MLVDSTTGLLDEATYIASPHHDARPEGARVDLLVVHGISMPVGEFNTEAITALFCGQLDPAAHPDFVDVAHLRVSAHILITRTGRLLQFVPFYRRAWHAGVSAFEGREHCNDFSIGVELEGVDTRPYEAAQYAALGKLICALMQVYPITVDRVVGHADVAPGRKTDPGIAFDWGFLRKIHSTCNSW